MKWLGWLIGCALALACAHEGKGVAGESDTKMQGTAAVEAAKPQAASTPDASKQAEAAAVAPAVRPVAALPADGKIPLSTTPEAAELLRRGYDALFTTNIGSTLLTSTCRLSAPARQGG